MHAPRQLGLVLAYVGLSAALLVSGGCHGVEAAGAPASGQAAASPDPQTAAKLHFYQAEVLPTLQKNCLRCHGGMNRRGGFNMSTRASLLQGGKDGPAVILSRPEDSLLLHVIDPRLAEDDPMRMPPKGDRLSAEQVAAIRKWVTDGLVMDR